MSDKNIPSQEKMENIVRSGINYSPNKHLKPCSAKQRETNVTCTEYQECFNGEWENGCTSSHSLKDGAHYLSIINPKNVIKNRCFFLVTKHPDEKLYFSGLIFISSVLEEDPRDYNKGWVLGEPIPFEPDIVRWNGHYRGEKFITNGKTLEILKSYYSKIKDKKVKQIIDFYETGELPGFAGKTYWYPEADGSNDMKPVKERIIDLLQENLNVILHGPPGTGKTWVANQVKKQFKHRKFMTFHQSYSYEDFIEGIKPKVNENNDIYYEVEDGIFKDLCKRAIKNTIEKDNPTLLEEFKGKEFFKNLFEKYKTRGEREKLFENADKFLLIIDEINRGNISKIFGELITLVEKDKRIGKENEIIVTLPYSKENFGIPPNILLLGTMNTADRSIALLDVALRRRFDFYSMPPKAELLKEVDGIDLNQLLDSLNKKIVELYDKDHQIGHSYFLDVEDLQDLKYIWFYRIVPLLQEYFYNDNEKIEKIVGKEFSNLNNAVEMEDKNFKEALLRIAKGSETG